jgi:hypothetical protein
MKEQTKEDRANRHHADPDLIVFTKKAEKKNSDESNL